MDPCEDLFDHLFGRPSGNRQSQKGEDRQYTLEVTLEDLYKGKKVNVEVTKKIICVDCDGRGGKEGSVKTCKNCDGFGRFGVVHRIGERMVEQGEVECDKCEGAGKFIADDDKCTKCDCCGTTEKQNPLEIDLIPGMQDGENFGFEAEGDEEPGVDSPGDAIVFLQTKPHKEFERNGNDLIIKRTITLADALCGFTIDITHLDGRNVRFTPEDGKVIQDDSIGKVIGEGMPILRSKQRGDLHIVFDVSSPNSLSEDDCKELESLLGCRRVESLPVKGDKVTEVSLSQFDSDRHGFSQDRSGRYDESSDESGHQQQQQHQRKRSAPH